MVKSLKASEKTTLRKLSTSEIAPNMGLKYFEHAAMDRAHHKFTALLGALPLLKKEAFGPVLEQIFQEAKEHFAQEERFMQTTAFDQYAAHKLEHDTLLAELESCKASIAAGESVSAVDLQLKMCAWQDNHQQKWDYPLADFLRCRASWQVALA